nr:class I SAM-dependent methyltransferase [Psychrobacter sp. FDAARGOS_221]
MIIAGDVADDDVNVVLTLVKQFTLPLNLTPVMIEEKLTQKVRKRLSDEYARPILTLDNKQQLSLLTGQVSVSPAWQSLQRRVVSAGRKSELLLQACKLTQSSHVLDATAGFGHDSLILASTGATVVMLERNPLMALLLEYEQQKMAQHKNWQKLMSRLQIVCTDASDYMANYHANDSHKADSKSSQHSATAFDVIYLDPMFPDNSYEHANSNKGAKVGKHMQALHDIALPPDIDEEQALLNLALNTVNHSDDKEAAKGRVVVKRPVTAPLLANCQPDEQWQNDVLRFDAYFAHNRDKI